MSDLRGMDAVYAFIAGLIAGMLLVVIVSNGRDEQTAACVKQLRTATTVEDTMLVVLDPDIGPLCGRRLREWAK